MWGLGFWRGWMKGCKCLGHIKGYWTVAVGHQRAFQKKTSSLSAPHTKSTENPLGRREYGCSPDPIRALEADPETQKWKRERDGESKYERERRQNEMEKDGESIYEREERKRWLERERKSERKKEMERVCMRERGRFWCGMKGNKPESASFHRK